MKEKLKQFTFLWQWKAMKYLSYLLVFLVPLYIKSSSDFYSFGGPKLIITIGIVLLMLFFYAWGLVEQKKISIKITYIHIALVLFLLVLTIASLAGVDPFNSFFGSFRDSINLILIYSLSIFAILLGFLINKDKKIIPKILLISLISNILVSSLLYFNSSLPSYLQDGSTIGNSSYLGAYALFNFCFGVGLIFYYSKIWQKILVALGLLVIYLSPTFFDWGILLGKVKMVNILQDPTLLLGDANGATIGIIISLFTILCLYFISSSKKTTKIIGKILMFSFLAGLLFTSYLLVTNGTSLNKLYVQDKTTNRFTTWNIAEKSFKDHLLLGTGFNNFGYAYQNYFNPEILNKAPENFYQAHNVVWEFSTASGIIGLLSYLLLLASISFGLYKSLKDEDKKYLFIKIALLGILLGYFVQNLFVFDTPTTYLMLFLLIGVSISFSKNIFEFNLPVKAPIEIFSTIIIIFSFFSMYFFVLLPWVEITRWGLFSSLKNTNDLIDNREGLQDISVFGSIDDSTMTATKFLEAYSSDLNKIDDLHRDGFIKDIDSTNNMVLKDMVRQPKNVSSHLVSSELFVIHMVANQKFDEDLWNKSKNQLDIAISLNHNDPDIYISLARLYTMKKDFNNAEIAAQKAIEVAPEYKDSYDLADSLLSVQPNNNFKNYVDNMKKIWIDKTLKVNN